MSGLDLRRMTESDYAEYAASAIEEYAMARMEADDIGRTDAIAVAEGTYRTLLPLGASTPGHHLFKVIQSASGDAVGTIWFGPNTPRFPADVAFLYDIVIDERHRGKGYGEAAMRLFEDQARRQGMRKAALNVFGYNTRARRLYEKLDYRVASLSMMKTFSE